VGTGTLDEHGRHALFLPALGEPLPFSPLLLEDIHPGPFSSLHSIVPGRLGSCV
jgi:hypothetical protein